MLNVAAIAVVLAYFMLVWFRTNAFVEYMNLFKLGRFLKVSEYTQIHADGYGGNYVDFLVEYYKDYFLVRLVSCPVCLSFWLGVSLLILTGSLSSFLAAPLMLFFYLLFNRML
jgi:hypothetical protein